MRLLLLIAVAGRHGRDGAGRSAGLGSLPGRGCRYRLGARGVVAAQAGQVGQPQPRAVVAGGEPHRPGRVGITAARRSGGDRDRRVAECGTNARFPAGGGKPEQDWGGDAGGLGEVGVAGELGGDPAGRFAAGVVFEEEVGVAPSWSRQRP